MFKLLNKLGFVGALCLLTFPTFARVCFLPDAADCKSGNTKYSYKDDNVGCEFKSKAEADAKIGKNECQEAYQSGVCYYIRCKDDMRAAEVPDEHKLYMGSEKDCLAQAHERTHGKTGVKKKCVPCAGGCWKLEDSSIGPDIYHTCKEMGYVVKDSCKADYLKFEPISLVDKNGDTCGNCAKLTCSQMGVYKTKGTCAADEEFEAVDKIDAYSNICGNCKKKQAISCTIEEGNNPNQSCKYNLAYNSSSSLPVTLKEGESTTIWANSVDNSQIKSIEGFSGTSYESSNSVYKNFKCDASNQGTTKVYALCGSRETPSVDPDNGKTYYVVVDKNLIHLTYPTDENNKVFSVDAVVLLPAEASNDTFFAKNNVRFGVQIYAYADFVNAGNAADPSVTGKPRPTYRRKAATNVVEVNMAEAAKYSELGLPVEHSDEPIETEETGCTSCSWAFGNNPTDAGFDADNSKYWVLKENETIDNTQPMSSDCQKVTVGDSYRVICYTYPSYSTNTATVYLAYYPDLMYNDKILDTSAGVPSLIFTDTIEPRESATLIYHRSGNVKDNETVELQKITLTLHRISEVKKSSYQINLNTVAIDTGTSAVKSGQKCEYRVMTKNDFKSKGASSTFMHTGAIDRYIYNGMGGYYGSAYGGSVWRSFPNLSSITEPGEYVAVMACTSTSMAAENKIKNCSEIGGQYPYLAVYRESSEQYYSCDQGWKIVPNLFSMYGQCTICGEVK